MFKFTETGPVRLMGFKSMVVLATCGGKYAGTESDPQTPLIKIFWHARHHRDWIFLCRRPDDE